MHHLFHQMFTIFPQSFTNPKATKCSRFVHKMQHLCIFNFRVFYSHIPHFITIRNEVAKVMFLQASVCPWGGGGVCLSACSDTTPPRADTPERQTPPQKQTPPGSRHPPGKQTPPEQTPPPPRYGHCCGWYASYWNAFLFCTYGLYGQTYYGLHYSFI